MEPGQVVFRKGCCESLQKILGPQKLKLLLGFHWSNTPPLLQEQKAGATTVSMASSGGGGARSFFGITMVPQKSVRRKES
jgi:hypothetical protein